MRTAALGLALSLSALAAQADETGTETMIVVQKGDDSLAFFEGATGVLRKRVEVGKKPHEIELSADGKLAYVTLYGIDRYTEDLEGGRAIAIVDLDARRKTGEIDLGRFRRPHGIARGKSGRLYVTCDRPPALVVVDPGARKVVGHVDVGQALPHMVVVTPDEAKAYTANSGAGTVTAIVLGAGEGESKVLKHLPIGGVPMGLALSTDGRRLYAANRTGDEVVVIDPARDEVVQRLKVPGNPARVRVLPGRKRILVSLIEAGSVAVLDTEPLLQEARRFMVGRHAEGLGIDPSGKFGYVSAQDDNRVIKFSLILWEPVLFYETGRRPDPIVIRNEASH
jgi:YVTN family beta-propeller protein